MMDFQVFVMNIHIIFENWPNDMYISYLFSMIKSSIDILLFCYTTSKFVTIICRNKSRSFLNICFLTVILWNILWTELQIICRVKLGTFRYPYKLKMIKIFMSKYFFVLNVIRTRHADRYVLFPRNKIWFPIASLVCCQSLSVNDSNH